MPTTPQVVPYFLRSIETLGRGWVKLCGSVGMSRAQSRTESVDRVRECLDTALNSGTALVLPNHSKAS